jgi:hypothetical protein
MILFGQQLEVSPSKSDDTRPSKSRSLHFETSSTLYPYDNSMELDSCEPRKNDTSSIHSNRRSCLMNWNASRRRGTRGESGVCNGELESAEDIRVDGDMPVPG